MRPPLSKARINELVRVDRTGSYRFPYKLVCSGFELKRDHNYRTVAEAEPWLRRLRALAYAHPGRFDHAHLTEDERQRVARWLERGGAA